MKIEKLNDRQIRCTLNKKDLTERELQLSELAYGTDKAKALFREMMQQAYNKFGFEAEDIPLMIEAIPVSNDCLVLVVTKVENPEELDTRFSKFTSGVNQDDDDDEDYELSKESDEDDTVDDNSSDTAARDTIMNCFGHISDLIEKVAKQTGKSFIPLDGSATGTHPVSENEDDSDNTSAYAQSPTYRLYRFDNLEVLTKACSYINPFFTGQSMIFHSKSKHSYLLLLYMDSLNDVIYNRVCGIMSEFATQERSTYATLAFLTEHMDIIIAKDAVSVMSKI